VTNLENTVIQVLSDYQICAKNRCDAPGVYVDEAKICSIGLRVRRGCSYHGIAFNIAMDLEPFARINPCGLRNLAVTQLQHFSPDVTVKVIEKKIVAYLQENFGYNHPVFIPD
jgi:lipoyl(octanoyl) transferase